MITIFGRRLSQCWRDKLEVVKIVYTRETQVVPFLMTDFGLVSPHSFSVNLIKYDLDYL